MYVRWQSRKRRSEFGSHSRDRTDTRWSAVLVENVRIDGKPTQRHIAYLAGFTESALAIPAQQRFLWEHIEERLAGLSNRISPEDHKAIMEALIKKIGRPPTKAQRAKLDRSSREELLNGLAPALGKPKRT